MRLGDEVFGGPMYTSVDVLSADAHVEAVLVGMTLDELSHLQDALLEELRTGMPSSEQIAKALEGQSVEGAAAWFRFRQATGEGVVKIVMLLWGARRRDRLDDAPSRPRAGPPVAGCDGPRSRGPRVHAADPAQRPVLLRQWQPFPVVPRPPADGSPRRLTLVTDPVAVEAERNTLRRLDCRHRRAGEVRARGPPGRCRRVRRRRRSRGSSRCLNGPAGRCRHEDRLAGNTGRVG